MTPRALIGPLLAAAIVVGCAPPAPSSSPVVPSPSASAAVAPSPTAAPTAEPTPSPAPTPVATIEPAGVEAFSPLENGRWEIISSEDNFGPATEVKVLAPMTEFVEAFVQCSGSGTLDVRITATPPATDPPDPNASPYQMAATPLDCPETTGLSISLAAPIGWFASPEGVPSDPSIDYQILIGTIVD